MRYKGGCGRFSCPSPFIAFYSNKALISRVLKAQLMKTLAVNGWKLFISLILAVFVTGTALAGVGLDLGSAPLYPGEVVFPGDTVQIPVFLSNYPNGPLIVATSNEITYDSTYLTPLIPALGPTAQAAGKDIRYSIPEPGLYIVGVFAINQNLNTPIADGIVVYARFKVSDNAPTGMYLLGNKPGCTTADATDIPVSGMDGFIDVSGASSSTTTSVSYTTTSVSSTTTTTIEPEVCAITITPASISVAAEEQVAFTATVTGAACSSSQLQWSIVSPIGSTIDDTGNYQAGENNTGATIADTVMVIDSANNISATATISVSAIPAGEITRITPKTIYSSSWRARLHLLIIKSDQGNFKNTSKLIFNPAGDITPLGAIAAGRIMIAFVSVKPNAQGLYDVTVSTDTMIYTKKDGLNVARRPLFSGSRINLQAICWALTNSINLR